MIQITRAQARQFRAVVRRTAPLGTGRGYRPDVALEAGETGLRVRSSYLNISVEAHFPGSYPTETIVLPGAMLDDLEGRQDSVVEIVQQSEGLVQARWDDDGMPQNREYDTSALEKQAAFPEEPKKFAPMDDRLLRALDDATQTSARENVRFALNRVQLRGKTGEIVGTDGRQLLIQRGFPFPWKDDVLIPALGVFGNRDWTGPVSIGRTGTHICICIGAWSFHLLIDAGARFPRIEQVIPAQYAKGTAIRIAPDDLAFLVHELPRLPDSDDEHKPVTVDLNGHIAVRARKDDQTQTTELLLNRSESVGPPVRLVSDRQFLARAARLGFREIFVKDSTAPIVARDQNRLYVWVPLGGEQAIPPSKDSIRIESIAKNDIPSQEPSPVERKPIPMPPTQNNGHPTNDTPAPSAGRGERSSTMEELITEVEEVRTAVAEVSARLSRLVSGLKQHRRQSRAVQAAMQSLRQFKLG